MGEYNPKIVCFSCKFGWGYLADEAELSPRVPNWVPVICTGKIDTAQLLDAFRQGADGILILGCREGDCHYQDGNHEARKRVRLAGNLLESLGIESERLRIELSHDAYGETIPQLVEQMRRDVARLGPLSRASPGKPLPEKAISGKGGR